MVSHAGVGWGFKKHKRQRRKVKEWERERERERERSQRAKKRGGDAWHYKKEEEGSPFLMGQKTSFLLTLWRDGSLTMEFVAFAKKEEGKSHKNHERHN